MVRAAGVDQKDENVRRSGEPRDISRDRSIRNPDEGTPDDIEAARLRRERDEPGRRTSDLVNDPPGKESRFSVGSPDLSPALAEQDFGRLEDSASPEDEMAGGPS